MNRKLNQADLWLISEITTEMQKRFDISLEKAKECIGNSNLMPMLYSNPKFVHHEDSNSWIRTIGMQNNLKELIFRKTNSSESERCRKGEAP